MGFEGHCLNCDTWQRGTGAAHANIMTELNSTALQTLRHRIRHSREAQEEGGAQAARGGKGRQGHRTRQCGEVGTKVLSQVPPRLQVLVRLGLAKADVCVRECARTQVCRQEIGGQNGSTL